MKLDALLELILAIALLIESGTGALPAENTAEPEPAAVVEYVLPEVDRDKIRSRERNTLHTWGEFTPEQQEDLDKISEILAGYEKPISVIAYPLDGENGFSYNSRSEYFSACTIKAAYILSLCKYLEQENYDPATLLTYKEEHYFEGSGKIRYSEFGTQYSVEYLINQALSISDNVAYRILLDNFGRTIHNDYMDELGCRHLKTNNMWAPYATAEDFIVIWRELYLYFQTDTVYSRLYKRSCTGSASNYLASDMKEWPCSHKSGHNYGSNPCYNDVILVWKDRPYILAVFTASEGDKQDRTVVKGIADIVNYSLY